MPLIPVQPRNSTVQCIFLANLTHQVLPFPMVVRVPAQLSTSKLCKPFRFRFYEKHRGVGYCRRPRHSSRATRHFCVPLSFHDLTNPSFRLPTHIDLSCQALCFHTVAHSLSSSKKSSALESATSGLFLQNTRGGVYGTGANRRAASAMGKPTQKMWMTTPMTIILNE